MKKAFIFDLDGTLANTLNSISYFGNRALEMYGFPPIDTYEYRYMVGNGAATLVHRILAASGNDSEENFANVFPMYNDSYDADFMYLTEAYAGVPEAVARLKEAGMKLAVLSNKPHSTTLKVVAKLYGEGLFDAVYGQREGIPLKPDPGALRSVMAELGVTPEESVYVGDTATDMKTGKSADVFTVGVLWGFRDEAELQENHADAIIASPARLLDFLE